jgi:hypothetical protein
METYTIHSVTLPGDVLISIQAYYSKEGPFYNYLGHHTYPAYAQLELHINDEVKVIKKSPTYHVGLCHPVTPQQLWRKGPGKYPPVPLTAKMRNDFGSDGSYSQKSFEQIIREQLQPKFDLTVQKTTERIKLAGKPIHRDPIFGEGGW